MSQTLRTAALLLAAALAAGLTEAAPAVSQDAATVTLRNGADALTAARADATVTFRGRGQEFTLRPRLQLGSDWTAPLPSAAPALTERDRGTVRVRLSYPVPEDRRLTVTLTACEGVPAVFLTTRLEVLRDARAQYYFLQSSLPCPGYEVAAGSGDAAAAAQHSVRLALDPGKWDALRWADWWFVPRGASGIVLLPTNVGGRAPGEGSALYLHALPRNALLGAGDGLEVNVGLAAVPDAVAAAQVSAAAQARRVAVLRPWEARPARVDYGAPAPAWLRKAEVYNLYYRNAALWTPEVVESRLRGFPLIVGSTPDTAALQRCHERGLKLLHYVVYTCLLDTKQQVAGGGQVYSEWSESADCESRDLADHPDWVCLDTEGKPVHDAWGLAHGHPGLLNTCLHQPGLRRAAVHQVELLMQRGYDGVFIDLAGPTVECHGAALGQHRHEHPDWSNTRAYEELLAEIYAAVKRYGSDRIVMQNTCTGLLDSHWASCDSQMLEAVPYAEGSLDQRLTPPEFRWYALRQQPAVQAGKVPVVLTYFGGAPEAAAVQAAAETSYAWARLSGFLWADAFGLQDLPGLAEWSRRFYARRLGAPRGPVAETADGLVRQFAEGTVRLHLGGDAVTGRVVPAVQ